MGDRQIGFVSVARSDRGHLSPLLALLPTATLYEYRPAQLNEPFEVAGAAGYAVSNFASQFHYGKPDLVVVFGDRWEQHAAATAAFTLGIPIAHLHAGEQTQAVLDDGYRAAISALATIHVTAAHPYCQRLEKMGYARVYCLGAPGLARLGPRIRPLGPRILLVAFHPETKNLTDVGRQACELSLAIGKQVKDGALAYLTAPGMDAGRQAILDAFQWLPVTEFTDDEWVKAMRAASVIVGNSSCGIIEAPSIPLPAVNVGNRQAGRLMASSVITVPAEGRSIYEAIEVACHPVWQKSKLTGVNPYGDRGAAERIAELLTTCAL